MAACTAAADLLKPAPQPRVVFPAAARDPVEGTCDCRETVHARPALPRTRFREVTDDARSLEHAAGGSGKRDDRAGSERRTEWREVGLE